MRALLLVDIDNVLERGSEDPTHDFAQQASKAVRRLQECGPVTDVAVACAFNTNSVYDYELSFEGLRKLGSHFRDALGAREGHTEIALALTMPQTADVLLRRLMTQAPRQEWSGSYDLVVLFSGDVGLSADIGDHLARCAWVRVLQERWAGTAWARGSDGRPAIRQPPARCRSGSGTAPSLDAVTVEIRGGDAIAQWAGQRRVDCPLNISLHDLAQLVDRKPWVLSQLGATKTSLRGIARLERLPSDHPVLLAPVSPKEGLEVPGMRDLPRTGTTAREASVGIGAVRLLEPGATVSTRLPVQVLEALPGDIPLSGGRVHDHRPLQRVQFGAALGEDPVQVQFRRAGDTLVAKVVDDAARQPKAWWADKYSASSEQRIPGAGTLVSEGFACWGVPVRSSLGGNTLLSLGAPARGPVRIRPLRPIPEHGLGLCVEEPDSAGRKPMALLALQPVLPDAVVSAHPLDRLERSGPLVGLPEGLWRLPLLVLT